MFGDEHHGRIREQSVPIRQEEGRSNVPHSLADQQHNRLDQDEQQQGREEFERPEVHLFLGEERRAFFRHLHIVDAARLVLLADLAKLAIESAYFVAHIGYVDAICFLQISWALIGTALAMPALFHKSHGERYYRLLWPLLAFKVTECLICLFVLLLIFVLGVFGPLGYSILRLLIKWKYRRVEDDEAIAFCLGTFLVVSLLLVLNCYFLHIFWRLRTFLHSKALFLYLSQRNEAIRALRPSFFLFGGSQRQQWHISH